MCGRVTRRQDGAVLLTDPRNFREKSVRVGVHNTELMNVVWSCSWNAVCGRVTKRQDGVVLLTDPRNFREKSVCVGVHNTELMERGVVLLMERGVGGRVTRRQDAAFVE